MKKLFLTIMEGEDARHARTLIATCDETLISKVAAEINVRLTGAPKPDPLRPKNSITRIDSARSDLHE
jgi:hypothetical protein